RVQYSRNTWWLLRNHDRPPAPPASESLPLRVLRPLPCDRRRPLPVFPEPTHGIALCPDPSGPLGYQENSAPEKPEPVGPSSEHTAKDAAATCRAAWKRESLLPCGSPCRREHTDLAS